MNKNLYVRFNDFFIVLDNERTFYFEKVKHVVENKKEVRYKILHGSANHMQGEIFITNNNNLNTIVFDKIVDAITNGQSVSFNFNNDIKISDDELNVLINEIK